MSNYTEPSLEYSKKYMWKLMIVAMAMVGTMATWFSMTAVLPVLLEKWSLNGFEESLITVTVQGGFVTGSLLFAFLNIPDRIRPAILFLFSAVSAGILTMMAIFIVNHLWLIFVLRFSTGMALSGVYGPGLQLISSWFRVRRGMALGIVVGALTLGSATPHLYNVFWSESWKLVLIISGITSIISGLLIFIFVSNGPYSSPVSTFNTHAILKVIRYRPVRLANYGYLGHMWELYAMWSWFGIFLADSLQERGMNQPAFTSLITFIVIGSGLFGAWFGGIIADKYGRERLTLWSLCISGCMALSIGFFYGGSPWLVISLGIVWGISIIADSAQFAALVTEHADRRYVGSALTFQLAVGFAITMIAILMISFIKDSIGWHFSFLILVPGPLIGFISIYRLLKWKMSHS